VNYLAQIIVYWKARKEAEKEVHSLDNFNIENKNTKDGCLHHKEGEQLADTRIWSYCLYEQCHDIVVNINIFITYTKT
jgi:hypothetical protein